MSPFMYVLGQQLDAHYALRPILMTSTQYLVRKFRDHFPKIVAESQVRPKH